MRAQSGFTLIEVLVTGIISVVLGGAILTTLNMTGAQIKEGTSFQKLSLIQEAITGELERQGRKGFMVKPNNGSGNYEGVGKVGLNFAAEELNRRHVYFCDTAGNPYAGYAIVGDVLMEWRGNTASNIPIMQPITIGEMEVRVDPDSSGFDLLQFRSGARYTLRFKDLNAPGTPFPTAKGVVQCRNHTR